MFLCFYITVTFSTVTSSMSSACIVPGPRRVIYKSKRFILHTRTSFSYGLAKASGSSFMSCMDGSPLSLVCGGGKGTSVAFGLIDSRGTGVGRRSCHLGIVGGNVRTRTASTSKLFCTFRSVIRLTHRDKGNACRLPRIAVRSTPHFSCQNVRLSISHRFCAGRFIGGRVSTLTHCGLGHFR